jgi:DNA (cytosine-5)-methyltransferase 1
MDSLELCAGAGGQALGIEQAGFEHSGLVEIDHWACETLRANRPNWSVYEADLTQFDPSPWRGVDLLAGGLPCPPFSVAGKQLGEKDERNLFDIGVEFVDQLRPRAVMFENVRGLLSPVFEDYRSRLQQRLGASGYFSQWIEVNARDLGVPQLRPRVVFIALKRNLAADFRWGPVKTEAPLTVGETLKDMMAANGWKKVARWVKQANAIAPTIVGGSKKHGGPDLGPTRAKKAWAQLGVNGMGIADEPPSANFEGDPKLTVPMVALLQGFPPDWKFVGRKTHAYRQVGNAFPPPVAKAVATALKQAIERGARKSIVVSKIAS